MNAVPPQDILGVPDEPAASAGVREVAEVTEVTEVAQVAAVSHGSGGPAAGSRLVRRRRAVVLTAAIAVVLSVGGLVGARWVQSPSQAAADTHPPKPSVITAPVVRQVLRSTVVLRGTFSDGRTVSATPTEVAATEVASQPAQLMVTGVYAHPGQRVGAGKALVEYSGRPVFALPGVLPAYRDLTFGEQGKDVAQLQSALRALGHPTGADAKGVFGPGTEAAVRALYAAMGYPVPVTPGGGPSGRSGGSGGSGDGKEGDVTGSGGTADGKGGSGGSSGAPAGSGTGASAHAMVPASEVVFVPALPARVVSVPVAVGDPVKGPVVTLARGGMTLTGMLDPSQAGLVTAGMKATVLSEATGASAGGTVTAVGALVNPGDGKSGGDGADQQGAQAAGGATTPYLPLAIRPTGAWASAFADQDVRITITAAATTAAVLTVPQAAVAEGADARTTVTAVGADGRQHVVQVRAGVSAGGMVEVTPVGAALTPGEKVVVGQ